MFFDDPSLTRISRDYLREWIPHVLGILVSSMSVIVGVSYGWTKKLEDSSERGSSSVRKDIVKGLTWELGDIELMQAVLLYMSFQVQAENRAVQSGSSRS